jgi:hypothetical protein
MYGADVNVVFTGSRYFFFSEWYGLFCVAERVQEVEDNDITKAAFVLFVEENGSRGGDWKAFAALAKKVINKSENKYISREVSYKIEFANVERWAARMELVK